jgi:phage baseplate assembly protein gpV
MADTTNDDIAAKWLKGLTGDIFSLAELSSENMRVWHSFDGTWLTRDEATARMMESGMSAAPPALENPRALVTDAGFIVQASAEGIDGGGRTHVVQILTVEGGQVIACEEYVASETPLGGSGS